jgi:hypothetical protein
MDLIYNNYNNIDMEVELKKILLADRILIQIEQTNKICLFLLGMMFVNGKKIEILNEKELNLESTNKSFSLMSYVWSKLSNDSFPNKDYSNVWGEIDQRIENIKRLGVTVKPIENKPIDKKIFLICPVRNATPEQKKWIEDYVVEKHSEHFIIHAPHLHTVQRDLFGGYGICIQNAEAVASSSEIDIYYDQESTGSVFDLGVAYALQKPLKVLNKDEIVYNDDSYIDQIIKNWSQNQKAKVLSNQ